MPKKLYRNNLYSLRRIFFNSFLERARQKNAGEKSGVCCFCAQRRMLRHQHAPLRLISILGFRGVLCDHDLHGGKNDLQLLVSTFMCIIVEFLNQKTVVCRQKHKIVQ